jgi:plasmid maintenance system antidote protein VapI
MPKRKTTRIRTALLDAIKASGESLYRIAKDAGLPYSRVHDFANGKGDVSIDNAEKLCEYFGLELRPERR